MFQRLLSSHKSDENWHSEEMRDPNESVFKGIGEQMGVFSVAAAGKPAYTCVRSSQLACVVLQISHSMSCLLFGGHFIRHTRGSWCYCGGERKGTRSTNP